MFSYVTTLYKQRMCISVVSEYVYIYPYTFCMYVRMQDKIRYIGKFCRCVFICNRLSPAANVYAKFRIFWRASRCDLLIYI